MCEASNDESDSNHDLIQKLVQEITLLKAQNAELNTRIELLSRCKFAFDKDAFLRNPTVEHLSMCYLDQNMISTLLSMFGSFDFSCAKSIIDLWVKGLFDWNKDFYDTDVENNKRLIQFVCRYGCEEAILYILDIYDEKDLDLICDGSESRAPIHVLCSHGIVSTINRILDIYVKKNLDLTRKNRFGSAPIHILCKYGEPQTINRILDIYLEKNLDLEQKKSDGWLPIHLLCKHGVSQTINRMIDIYLEKNLDLRVECGTYTPLYLLCVHGPLESIKHLVHIYLDKNYSLNDGKVNGYIYRKGHEYNYLHVICKNREMPIIKFMIDLFIERKLSLNGTPQETLCTMFKTNRCLKNNTNNINLSTYICMYLNEKEFEVYC